MRFKTLLVLLLGACASTAGQVRDRPVIVSVGVPQAGSISGRVEIEIDRQRAPIRRARVTLTAESGGPQWTATSDTDGRYRFERLAAGTYRVRAAKLGFVALSSNPEGLIEPATVQIKPGDALTADMRMQRGGALEGRFIDDQGRPIRRLAVYADRIVGAPGRPTATHSATTDDLGRFRVHTLPPGTYYLRATPPPPASGGDLYYPGVASSREATVLAVASGQTLERLDFTVATAPLSEIAAEALAAGSPQTTPGVRANTVGAQVSGRLTRTDTGAPIANALLQMLSLLPGGVVTTRSTGNGQFEFRGIKPGSYVMTASADGYVSVDDTVIRPVGSGRPVVVTAVERIERADLTLAPHGTIEGRVLDEFGDPAPGVPIIVTQLASVAGLSRFILAVGHQPGPTDDRGWFRGSGLPSGDYYLLAPSASLTGLMNERTGSAATGVADDEVTGFAPTFYPGTASPDVAMPVRVVAGTETRDVTFSLIGARMVTVVGTATDLAGRPAPHARMVLIHTFGGVVRTWLGTTTRADANGSFRFPSVPEGTFVVQGIETGLFGSLSVTAAATFPRSPLEVTLPMRPRVTARGQISFEGDAPRPADPTRISVRLRPTDFTTGPVGGNAITSRVSPSWSFEIPNLAWKGVIQVFAPGGWWLKSVRVDGRDITNTPYDFQSADVDGLEVVLTTRVGTVTGNVVDAGRPAANASIVVFGLDEGGLSHVLSLIAVAQSDAQGAFTIRGVPPGRYFTLAVPPASMPPFDPTAFAALRALAIPIDVSDGPSAPLTLKMIRR